MKGIILAGGSGTRLYPVTLAVSKQLLPVYEQPMIYYPLTDADAGGDPRHPGHLRRPMTARVLRRCSATVAMGLSLAYAEQPDPTGSRRHL